MLAIPNLMQAPESYSMTITAQDKATLDEMTNRGKAPLLVVNARTQPEFTEALFNQPAWQFTHPWTIAILAALGGALVGGTAVAIVRRKR